LSGAATGAAFGPWGAAIGGVAGGLMGVFGGGENDVPTYSNPFEGMMTNQALSDSNSRLGAETAAHASAGIEERVREQERDFNNNPDFAGNASVQSAYYNKSRSTAENNMIDANLKGAEFDQSTHEKGFGELSSLNTFDYGKYLNDVKQQQTPSFFESLAQQGLSAAVGSWMGKGFPGMQAKRSNTTTNNIGNSNGQGDYFSIPNYG